tara:strand:- start:2020 stop:2151 length:132 start_codon:yes stop_codon:yes gene_type:complete
MLFVPTFRDEYLLQSMVVGEFDEDIDSFDGYCVSFFLVAFIIR